jgi:hypothetical protein
MAGQEILPIGTISFVKENVLRFITVRGNSVEIDGEIHSCWLETGLEFWAGKEFPSFLGMLPKI